MNVTDLARQLKVHPQKLLQILPEFGFDIGARAVKIDDRVAQRIQREWRRIKFILEDRERKEKEKQRELEKEMRQTSGLSVKIPDKITVKEFAVRMDMPVNRLITELMKNGILVAQNENIDHDTAVILAGDMGFKVEDEKQSVSGEAVSEHVEQLETILEEGGEIRPPVIVVMGHVDHGKTKLLDAIRSANVVDQEAGGITQHIGAYQTVWTDPNTKAKKQITFIDTPGHEAFTVMRSRGAKVADLAILVVAADDGVKPQTTEAINIIKAAKIPMIVAINKIDKEGADPDRVRNDLAQYNIIPQEWGGDVPMVEISAKQKLNIDKLLDALLIMNDLHEAEIRANPARPAAGTVIEAHLDKGEGPVATILVQAGTLKLNDPLVINNEIYGKVRAMRNYRGEMLKEAPPSTPVRILGFKVAPQVGDVLDVGRASLAGQVDVKAKRTASSGAEKHQVVQMKEGEVDEQKKIFKVVIKADALGSLEAILGSLEKIKNEEVGIAVVGKGLGNLNADDVALASSSGAIIYGFNITNTPVAFEMLQKTGVRFEQYKIIYDLLDHVKKELEKLLNPELIVTELGTFKVLAIFRTDKSSMIVGGRVESGKLKKDSLIRVRRGGEIIGKGKLPQLQSGKQSINEAAEGTECGLQFDGKIKLEQNDILEAYKEEKKEKKLILQ